MNKIKGGGTGSPPSFHGFMPTCEFKFSLAQEPFALVCKPEQILFW